MNRLVNKITINQYGRLREIKNFFQSERIEIENTNNKKFWFLDAPKYGNVGDQAIAYAIITFLCEYFPKYEISVIHEEQCISNLAKLKAYIKPHDIIILQGGGNFGNLYPPYEYVRRKIVSTFNNNKIVIFPQSVYFTKGHRGTYELAIAKKIYSNNNNVYIFARELESFEFLKKNLKNVHIAASPDIVFYLKGKIQEANREGLGICLRQDNEKISFTDEQREFIKEQKDKYNIVKNIDTIIQNNNITECDRENIVLSKLREFASCELIITDRLHGMIFSYITGTPCVFFDSKTKKSTNIYRSWLKNNKYVIDFSEIRENIQNNKDLNFDFSSIRRAIEEDYENSDTFIMS